MEELIKLAGKFNVSHDKFIENIENGLASEELQKDIEESHKRGIHSFPTMLIEYGDKSKYINGYMDYDTLLFEINQLTGGEIEFKQKEFSLNNAIEFISIYHKVCAKELQTAFNLSENELENVTEELIKSGMFEKDVRGTSYFIKEKSLLGCDPVTGVCSF